MVYFQTRNLKIGYILEGLGIDNVGIFCVHMECFTTIWHVSWPFGIFCGPLVNFPPLGKLYQQKSGNPGAERGGGKKVENSSGI
jgi:hypothetical protein